METHIENPQQYYAQHGSITHPGAFAQHFEQPPTEIADLCHIVQGFLLHVYWAECYGLPPAEIRRAEAGLRHVERMLTRGFELHPGPLTTTRPPHLRLIGNCRNFSILLCALLRQQGVPARVRCGFARYFKADHHEDHWVCEYWHPTQQRWILVDAQLDELQQQALGISFNPLDVPRDQFLVAGEAWHLCRHQQADPATFGIFDMKGLWFVRGNLVRDIAALNKMPLLPWDGWGLIDAQEADLSDDDWACLDQIAAASVGELDYAAVRTLYASDQRLQVPPIINSYTEGGVVHIVVASEKPVDQGGK